jgi:hypothetical protein
MRAILLLPIALAACTPDILSNSYLCGPEQACPEGQACNGPDNRCVLASQALPFACELEVDLEPDDTAAEAHAFPKPGCVSSAFESKQCLLAGDTADWVAFDAPVACTSGVEVQVRLTHPIAFELLGFELWDLDRDMKVADDGDCAQAAPTDDVWRCLDFELVPGARYGVKVHPTGEGTCDGACNYNRYSLSVQLATPG